VSTPSFDLSVSVVSYRTPELLAECLKALDSERGSLSMQVTVVDNASGDSSPDLVAARFPWVRLIRNDRNVGFGAAHNQAQRDVDARHLLVLNSDTRVAPGALRTLVDYLDQHPKVAIIGPLLRHPDGVHQPSRRRFPGVRTFFSESTQLQRFFPHNPELDRYYLADLPDDGEQEVDWLVGACLAVRARTAADLGLFDERFFLYSEELDLARRYRAAGWQVVYLPAAEVQHVEGGSSRQNLAARDRQFQASKLAYIEKWHGRRLARAFRAYLLAEYTFRAAEESLKLLRGSGPADRQARLRIIGANFAHFLRA